MDNNRMPRPEEDAPERAPAEAEPQIRELDFSPEEPAVEELTFSAAPESPAETAEPEDALPLAEEAPAAEEIPAEETAAAEELPAEAETPAEEAPAAEEESPTEEAPAADAPAEAPIAQETPVEELPAPAAAAEPEPTDPAPDTAMEAAEAAAEVPAEPSEAESAEAVLYAPEQPQIQGAREAMELHGMLDHGAPEPEFDMSLLDDPELALSQEQPAAEDPADREYRDDSPDFDAMFHAPAPEPEKAPLPRQTHKGRPKRKKGEGFLGIPNILATFVWLALIVMIGVTFGRMLWVCAADVLAFGRQDQVVTVTIYEADDMDTIIDKLHKGGLIRYKGLFRLYADISDAEEDIKPGIYDLNTRYDYHALVNFMSPSSTRQVVTLTIPEGYTCAQIFSLLEEHRICTAQDAAAYAADGELNDYWFLEGLERGSENCLEGYLFPDTYEFYKNSTPREALQRMLNNFEIKFTEEMRAQIDALNSKFGCEYTVREIAIIASMIEKESAHPDESPAIAGVIYNRLFDWGTNPAYLNIDASIVYALGGKTDLTREDLQIDHPYNTYTNIGLTPGPISNPGLASLKAALEPESHNYYFYVLNPATGKHTFSTTIEQHNSYVRTYAEAQ